MKRPIPQFSAFILLAILCGFAAYTFAATDIYSNIPERLGWVAEPVSCGSMCGGYYQDPLAGMLKTVLPPLETTPVQADADQTEFRAGGMSVLRGNVKLTQPGRWVNADQVELNRDAATGKITNATLTGNVVLREPGEIVVGDTGHVELQSKVANFMHAFYRILMSRFVPTKRLKQSLNAWGRASRINRLASGVTVLHHATYTTCSPTTYVWQISASQINLNHETGRGTARDTVVDFKGVPIFYSPYLNFPIDSRRESGFLFPTISITSLSGLGITIPYYWNLAPNYDALITPQILTERGLLTNGLFRYLTTGSHGEVALGFIPDDQGFTEFQEFAATKYTNPGEQAAELRRLEDESNNRGYFSWRDKTKFDPHWSGLVDYNYLSDDYYRQNFGAPKTLTPNQFMREGVLNYSSDNWTFVGQVQGFQTLHPVNQAFVTDPYQRLPQLDLNSNYPDIGPYGFDYQQNNQIVYFQRNNNPGEATTPMNAGRMNIQPIVSLPITGLPGYVIPKAQFAFTQYQIGNQAPDFSSTPDRALPILDLDSGLYFDRNVDFGTNEFEQTLEPRLFYLYVPFRNQDNIPIFDSGLIPFTYDSLFQTNRFSGYDRIGDANQVSLAITTRLLDPDSGAEKFHFSIGDIVYFSNRLVTACGAPGTPAAISAGSTCVDPATQVGATPPKEKFSPIAAQMAYVINPHWSTNGGIAWDQHWHKTINGTWNFQYQPWPNHVFNLSYNFIRLGDVISTHPPTPARSSKNDLNQPGLSFAWPINDNWHVVGSLNYNLERDYPQTYFYGIEYDNCCWALRLVQGRIFNALSPNGHPLFNRSFYLQWQLKGLGTVGTSDPTTLLTDNIAGYHDNFQAFEGLNL